MQTGTEQTDYSIDEVLIENSLGSEEISSIISEINIYENLSKSYLTAQITFVDSNRIIESLSMKGTEKVTIKISTNRHLGTDKAPQYLIEKVFYAIEIFKSIKTNDGNDLVTLNLIEDHGALSRLNRIAKAYTSKLSDTISKISTEYLERNVRVLSDDEFIDGSLKTIIPNLTPLKACEWLKDRMTTRGGAPWFLYSTIADNDIRLISIGKILGAVPLNKNTYPYVFSQGMQQSLDPMEASYNITGFEINRSENQFRLAEDGLIGSTYNFIDTLRNKVVTQKFTASTPMTQLAAVSTYDFAALGDGPSMESYDTLEIMQIAPTQLYEDNSYNYFQASGISGHMLKASSRSLRGFAHKTTIDIQVSGRNFSQTGVNKSIGNLINIYIPASGNDEDIIGKEDTKKSGAYMINSVRHIFSGVSHSAIVSCAKFDDAETEFF